MRLRTQNKTTLEVVLNLYYLVNYKKDQHCCWPCVSTLSSIDFARHYFRLTFRSAFPIRTSPDQNLFLDSPKLIAEYHVLHRTSDSISWNCFSTFGNLDAYAWCSLPHPADSVTFMTSVNQKIKLYLQTNTII